MGGSSKINFQRELDKIIEKIMVSGTRPGLLLHSCCGPCSSYVLSYLKDYFEITVVYYNPNIYPEEEYDHRKNEQLRLIREMNSTGIKPLIKFIDIEYDHEEFLDAAKGLEDAPEGGARCGKCFELRLGKTAEIAREKGFDYFGTTLTVSPHKDAMLLNSTGAGLQDEKLLWLPSDFKKKDGYKKSVELSKKYDLYRQNYCGCEYSVWFQDKPV